MANTAQAKKRARQAESHREHNASLRSMVRTYLKKVYSLIESGDKTQAQTSYRESVAVLDRMADKGLIHKNKAARHKSRMSAHIKKMGTSEAKATTTAKAKTAKPKAEKAVAAKKTTTAKKAKTAKAKE